jgi:hypothetical protein
MTPVACVKWQVAVGSGSGSIAKAGETEAIEMIIENITNRDARRDTSVRSIASPPRSIRTRVARIVSSSAIDDFVRIPRGS